MTFRIGIVGIGSVADTHARGIEEIATAELVAGSCRTRSKGEAFATKYGCAWYEDYEAMFAEADLDIALVCTPSGNHLQPATAAAEWGVHVLCEKPLEITTERIDEMITACEHADARLGGIFQNRYHPAARTVHEAAVSGRFGDLAAVSVSVPWWRPDEYYEDAWQGTQALDGGGALINQSIHGVDMAQWLAGAALDVDHEENPVAEVFAYTDTLGHDGPEIEVEDTAVLSLRYRDGTLGQVLATTSMYPGLEKRIQIGGRDGSAEIVAEEHGEWQFRHERGNATETLASSPPADDRSEYGRNVEAFLDAVESDEPYELDGYEARKAVAIVRAAYESAEVGRPIVPN
ncbi:Gfo/Idh/MocA family oxidoreductase [Haladaptatus sp. AB643]|uniref:Gfo/Idh/MocA family protein n=1 Tax=unclassified Haladaptatus TaxID=2622732 RepID=UPI00209C4D49|nr:Gfo/Idh/MocA family oxidoreductase [Haladaptatus sp. AB643]MCO8255662.1 Gfo/Idh/MocA family oxidoreductase [Haladaptatus sp. AB618]